MANMTTTVSEFASLKTDGCTVHTDRRLHPAQGITISTILYSMNYKIYRSLLLIYGEYLNFSNRFICEIKYMKYLMLNTFKVMPK